jgi:hypothetical protein
MGNEVDSCANRAVFRTSDRPVIIHRTAGLGRADLFFVRADAKGFVSLCVETLEMPVEQNAYNH